MRHQLIYLLLSAMYAPNFHLILSFSVILRILSHSFLWLMAIEATELQATQATAQATANSNVIVPNASLDVAIVTLGTTKVVSSDI